MIKGFSMMVGGEAASGSQNHSLLASPGERGSLGVAGVT